MTAIKVCDLGCTEQGKVFLINNYIFLKGQKLVRCTFKDWRLVT